MNLLNKINQRIKNKNKKKEEKKRKRKRSCEAPLYNLLLLFFGDKDLKRICEVISGEVVLILQVFFVAHLIRIDVYFVTDVRCVHVKALFEVKKQ